MAEPLLEARRIVKSFGRVRALRGANFTVFPGEVVALVGDNGAGKSTLVKCLAGVQPPDAGEILFEGRPVTLGSPLEARALGIETVYQDLALAAELDPAANLFLGREIRRGGLLGTLGSPLEARALGIETVYQDLALAAELDPAANLFLGREIRRGGLLGTLGFLDNREMHRRADEAFKSLGVGLQDSSAKVATMSGGQRQGVAVSRAVTWASKVVFMDEPTAALGVVQTRHVLDLILRVRDRGLSVVLISHNMPEVLEVADRIEVLRLGERVARFTRGEVSMEDIVGAMTGALRHEEAA
jgi:simple sugar transport system ATP-binding protein